MNDAELFVRYGVVVVCLFVLLFHVLCFSCSSQQQQTPTKSLVIQYVTLFRQVIFAGLLPIRPVRRHLDYRKRHVAYSVQIPAEELSPKVPNILLEPKETKNDDPNACEEDLRNPKGHNIGDVRARDGGAAVLAKASGHADKPLCDPWCTWIGGKILQFEFVVELLIIIS